MHHALRSSAVVCKGPTEAVKSESTGSDHQYGCTSSFYGARSFQVKSDASSFRMIHLDVISCLLTPSKPTNRITFNYRDRGRYYLAIGQKHS